ncbi:MAG TPA: ethanolamine ammonia lyase-activating protein [Chloroflexota bacterium]
MTEEARGAGRLRGGERSGLGTQPPTGPRVTAVNRESVYQKWQEGEGIPIHRTSYIADLHTLDVEPWGRVGQKGAFVNLAEQEEDDSYVLELAPGGQTEVLHHLFECTILVLAGRGATTLWQEGHQKQTVEWQRGTVFSPPLNSYYQHYNLDGQQPARLYAVTNAPMVMNLVRNADFLFNEPYVFADRYNVEEDFFSRPGERLSRNSWKTNYISDIRAFGLDDAANRGASGFLTQFSISNNQMAVHCSQFPPGTYKKAHRHNVGAHVVVLDGQGYSLLWFEGQGSQKIDWQDGSVLSPKEWEYHQHFNTGPTAARYMAMRLGNLDPRHYEGFMPDQIEYEYEDPEIFELYTRECASHGAEVVLPRPDYRRG